MAKKKTTRKTKKTTRKTSKTTKKVGGEGRELLAPLDASAIVPAHALLARGSTMVERKNVGAAVQAAISFEDATRVIAEATDEDGTQFLVSWR